MHHAAVVVAHASILTEGLMEHATVIFPAESYAEKDGTVVHPDGRLQRLRTAIARPGGLNGVRAGWQVIADVSKRAGFDQHVLTGPMAFKALVEAVPFYEGLKLEQISGDGVRWPEIEASWKLPPGGSPDATPGTDIERTATPPAVFSQSQSGLRLGTYRSIWASPEVELSPALQFTIAEQLVELSPDDAKRLGIGNGEAITVSQNGTRLNGYAAVRTGVPQGTAFLADGIASDSANALTEPVVEVKPAEAPAPVGAP
jgi:NADH-quinone oxidoreductase subunit G